MNDIGFHFVYVDGSNFHPGRKRKGDLVFAVNCNPVYQGPPVV